MRLMIAAIVIPMTIGAALAQSAHRSVLACVDTKAVGMDFINGEFQTTNFLPEKMLLTFDGKNIESKKNGITTKFFCEVPFPAYPQVHQCLAEFETIAFNSKTLQFTRTMYFGHLSGQKDVDSLAVAHGECTKF